MYNTGNRLYYILDVSLILDGITGSTKTFNLLNSFTITGTTYNNLNSAVDLSYLTDAQYNARYAGFVKYINNNYYIGFENSILPVGISADSACIPTTAFVPTTTSYVPTTTSYVPTTTAYVPTTTNAPIVNCLNGLIIETLYLNSQSDLDLLPIEYIHPCPQTMGTHSCNRAFFEVYGNSVYMADSLLSNAGGTLGSTTYSGKLTCTDYYNTPAELTGGVWTGNGSSRYSKTILTEQQAIDIAAAGGGSGTTISLSFLAAITTYSSNCDGSGTPHSDVNWLRISTPEGVVLWNSCVVGNNIYTIDVCT